MSDGMAPDRPDPPYVPDPLASLKKNLVKESLLEKKKETDTRIKELKNELISLEERQKALQELLIKL